MRVLLALGVICCTITASAQNKQLLYNVDDLPQTLLLNPGAEISFDKHIGIPFFSGTSFTVGPPTGEFGAYDFQDDSSFVLNFTDDETGDCGGAIQTTLNWSKQ